MRTPAGIASDRFEYELPASMIDVVFLLLIFFNVRGVRQP